MDDTSSGTANGGADHASGDVLQPAKKRAAFYALVLGTAMDVFALAGGTVDGRLRASYIGMIVVYVTLLSLSRVITYGRTFELLAISTVGAGLLFRFWIALHAEGEILGAGSRMSSIHAALIVIYLLSFTFFDKKLAGAASICVMAGGIIALGLRLAIEADLDLRIEGQPHIRTFAVHGICIALLYVLSASKEQMQEQQATASALTIVAGTDELTGIANRRALTTSLQREIARAERELVPLAVIIIDIDHFKSVNDTHGHGAGDAVLQRTAEVLEASIRASDLAGRWGGEEFLIVATDAGADAALNLAERCRRHLREDPFPGVGTVTASFGVATYGVGDTLESLVARADTALYAAKGHGRDRVELAEATGAADAVPSPAAR